MKQEPPEMPASAGMMTEAVIPAKAGISLLLAALVPGKAGRFQLSLE
nr:hypothetical protein [Sphingomonas sp. Y57]